MTDPPNPGVVADLLERDREIDAVRRALGSDISVLTARGSRLEREFSIVEHTRTSIELGPALRPAVTGLAALTPAERRVAERRGRLVHHSAFHASHVGKEILTGCDPLPVVGC